MKRWAGWISAGVIVLLLGAATANLAAAGPAAAEGGEESSLAAVHETIARLHEGMARLQDALARDTPDMGQARQERRAMGAAMADLHRRMGALHRWLAGSEGGHAAEELAWIQQEATA